MERNHIGATIADRYRLDRLLGEGGYGAVYAATHLEMGTPLAVKLLHAHHAESGDTTTRFRREARNTARLRHPHCVTVFDFGRALLDDEAVFFIAMELLAGHTVGQALALGEPMPWERVISILKQTLMALEAAHELGLVHRDLKPDNIFLTQLGPHRDHVKVLDFGIAKALENEDSALVTASGTAIGTPAFMSPEQCRGVAIDARSDLYSLGCVAWNLCVGYPPFKRDTMLGYLLAHVQEAPPSLAESAPHTLPPALIAWVERCLAKHADDRFDSATAAREALDRIQTAPGALTTGLGVALVDPPRAHLSRWIGVAALVLVGAAVAFIASRDGTVASNAPEAAAPVSLLAAPREPVTTVAHVPHDDVAAEPPEVAAEPAEVAVELAEVDVAVVDVEPDTTPRAELLSQALDAFCAEAKALPERAARTFTDTWRRRAPEVERALGQAVTMTVAELDPRRLAITLCLASDPTVCASCEVAPTPRAAPRSRVVTPPAVVRPDTPPRSTPTPDKPPEFRRIGD